MRASVHSQGPWGPRGTPSQELAFALSSAPLTAWSRKISSRLCQRFVPLEPRYSLLCLLSEQLSLSFHAIYEETLKEHPLLL